MVTKDDLMNKLKLIEDALGNVKTLISNNYAGLKARLQSSVGEDLTDVLTGLDALHAAVSGLPVSTGVVDAPPPPPDGDPA
jgi:hypothetical protein